MPAAPSQPATPAVGRKPRPTATAITMTRLTMDWLRLPRTCPVNTDARAMAMVRKRAMMPAVASMATEMAVP